MHLNTLKVAKGRRRKKKRLGRGIGSGKGKTCGRGMKGQLARSGGKVKPGFEGGQMPIQRRLPKFGFTSRKSLYRAEIRLCELNKLDQGEVTLDVLRKAGLISGRIKYVKVITKGDIFKSLTLKGIKVTASSRRLIEAQGGTIIDD